MMGEEQTGMQFHVTVSRDTNVEKAGRAVGNAVKEAFGESPVDLAFVFFSTHYAEDAQRLVKAIRHEVPIQVLLGCMGEGVIGDSEEFEGPAVVTLWAARLPKVHVFPMHLTFREEGNSYVMQGWPEGVASSTERPTFILLADPFSTPIEELFSRIDQQCPGAPAIGGVASGGADLGENCLVLNDEVFHTGIVGVVVWGAISIRTVVSQGCKPIGDRYVVTKAERNIIYELGGAPTLERLQTILQGLGVDEARQAAMALQVGVAFDEHRERLDRGDFLIRGLLGADQQSGGVAVSDLVKEGQTVQFHVRDAQSASEELNLLLAKDRLDFPKEVPKGALLFSCNGRGRRFFGEPHHDISAVQKRAGSIPVAGFFAAGEIGPVGGQNFIHGYTASVALFSEPTEASPSHQPHSS
ncbi:MAG: FIST N-terminal domain-containing protein [Nitrospirales bacterium]